MAKRVRKWEPVDIIILVLTVGVISVLIFPMYARFVNPDLVVSEKGVASITQIAIALIAVIALYVGAKLKK